MARIKNYEFMAAGRVWLIPELTVDTLKPSRNGQTKGIHFAADFEEW